MSSTQIAKRLTALEREVAQLKQQVERGKDTPGQWWNEIAGKFANDPIYDEAMRLGREYRESLRPGGKRRKK